MLPCLVNAAVDIYSYNTTFVMIKEGFGQIINGHYKIIHLIDLNEYEETIDKLSQTINRDLYKGSLVPQLRYQVDKINSMLEQIRQKPRQKSKRAINWLGTAWKWLAGSPDATDWDQMLKTSTNLKDNDNKQYFINKDLIDVSNRIIGKYNDIVKDVDMADKERLQQILFNKLSLLKDEVEAIVMAYQLAKNGIVHTALLNKVEIKNIISQTETLPFLNEIEAIENATPQMLLKNSTLIYVILLPQTQSTIYNNILIKPTVRNNKRIRMQFSHVLLSESNIYGIMNKCNKIRDFSLCNKYDLVLLESNNCIFQILRKTAAVCNYEYHEDAVVELVSEGTIFTTNFKGDLAYSNTSSYLDGTYVINFKNETIRINNMEYTNWASITKEILPPIFEVNLTEKEIAIDLKYLHKLHLNNVEKFRTLSIANYSSQAVFLFVIITVMIIYGTYQSKKSSLVFPIIEPIKINYPSSRSADS